MGRQDRSGTGEVLIEACGSPPCHVVSDEGNVSERIWDVVPDEGKVSKRIWDVVPDEGNVSERIWDVVDVVPDEIDFAPLIVPTPRF